MAESPTQTMRATRRRYELRSELGHGATATVWRARDTTTGRDVALKRFHPHLVADPVARQRIEDEAAAASRVSHPNIVSAVELIDDRERALEDIKHLARRYASNPEKFNGQQRVTILMRVHKVIRHE